MQQQEQVVVVDHVKEMVGQDLLLFQEGLEEVEMVQVDNIQELMVNLV